MRRAPREVGVVALDDVDAPRVGARDEAALLEDEPEQLVDVALGRDGARDLNQLAELVAVTVQPPAAALGAVLGVEQLERGVQRDEEIVGRGRLGHDRRQPGDERALEAALGGPTAALAQPNATEKSYRSIGEPRPLEFRRRNDQRCISALGPVQSRFIVFRNELWNFVRPPSCDWPQKNAKCRRRFKK